MSMDIEDLPDGARKDFPRSNGAPIVVIDGKRHRFSRASTYGRALDDESALVNWKLNRAIIGTAHDKALQARIIATPEDDRPAWKTLREATINAGRGAEKADIGTAVHAMSERWEQEPGYDPPEPYLSALGAYTDEMKRLGLRSQLFEFQTVCVEYRVAGTCDRLYELTEPLAAPNGTILEPGQLLVGDLKTSKRLDYNVPGFCIQMAAYAQGEFYDVEAEEFRPTPEINHNWGIIMHIDVENGTCQAHWADLDAGNYGLWLCMEIRHWRRKWRSGEFAAPDVDTQGAVGEAIAAQIEADDEWGVAMINFVRSRLRRIGEHPEARKHAYTFWPDDLPAPRDIDVSQHELITKALDFCDRVEARFELGWPEDDPRVEAGVHASELNRSNKHPLA